MSFHLFLSSSRFWIAGVCLLTSVAGCGGGSNGPSATPSAPAVALNFIAFVSTRDGAPEIYTMNPDGTGQTRVTTGIGSAGNPSQNRDGRIVFQSNRDGNSEIYTVNRDGSNLQRLTSDTGAATFSDTDAVFSPNGRTIAWTSNGGADGLYNVWLMNSDGKNKRQFASGFVATAYPAWTADGTQIAYYVVLDKGPDGARGNNEIQLKNVITGKATKPGFGITGASHLRSTKV